MPLYPLKFDPIYKAKVWGGNKFHTVLGRKLPSDEAIGESWELADLATTSASGGGGNAEHSVVSNGPLAGKTLQELIAEFGDQLMGGLEATENGCFPLLVKYLDASSNLSVQVHPSQSYADAHEDAHLKSECWYIMHAEPGAKIYRGIYEDVSPADFQNAINNNTVEEMMIAVEVQPGELYYLPSGTCHALGAGLLVAEIQTPSDTTFRVYDWGRTGRELHVNQAMQCIDFGPCDTSDYDLDTYVKNPTNIARGLVRCEYFQVDEHRARYQYKFEMPSGEPRVWMVLQGHGVMRPKNADVDEVRFEGGETLLLPANIEDCEVEFFSDCLYLEATFPQIPQKNLLAEFL